MRREAIIAGTVFAVLAVSSPSYAFAHNAVKSPWLHAILDVLTLAVVSAPLWTAFVWGGRRRPAATSARSAGVAARLPRPSALLALIAFVQLPVAVVAFVPIADPMLHATLLAFALSVTFASIAFVRRLARAESAAAGPERAEGREAPIRTGRWLPAQRSDARNPLSAAAA